jgi:hypothetical protein
MRINFLGGAARRGSGWTTFSLAESLRVLALVAMFGAGAHAAPLALNIYDTKYTTGVSTRSWFFDEGNFSPTNYYRTQVSAAPISDAIMHPVSGLAEAEANTGLFGVSTFTAAANGHHDPFRLGSHASAQTEIWFESLSSQTTTIGIDFFGWGQWYYSGGYVSLFDISTGNEIWNYWWDGSEGTVPWGDAWDADPRATAALSINTDFTAAAHYKLSIHAWSDSNPPDTERIVVQLTGLDYVSLIPEPSTFSLAMVGAIALMLGRRRR